MPDVIPMLAYEDGLTALEWLAKTFGFASAHGCLVGVDNRLMAKWKPGMD
jgi:uncharacterized glyoxalase superfamily protein PhnB